MIKEGDILYCHTEVIFEDGSISCIEGKRYSVEHVSHRDVVIIDEDSDEHHFPLRKDERSDCYSDWFYTEQELRERQIKVLLND